MPIYDFHCLNCNHEFESLSKPKEPVECPNCKQRTDNQKPCVAAGHIWKCGAADANPRQHFGSSKKGYSN